MSAIPGAIEEPYAGTTEVEYGLIKWVKVHGLYLRVLITLLLCLAIFPRWDNDNNRNDYDRDEPDTEVTVSASTVSEITVTATPDYK